MSSTQVENSECPHCGNIVRVDDCCPHCGTQLAALPVSNGNNTWAMGAALLNAVPFPIPIGYVVFLFSEDQRYNAVGKSVFIGTLMRLAAVVIGFFVSLFAAVVTEGWGDWGFGYGYSSGSSGSNWALIFLGFFTPIVLVLGFSAWDAWRMAKGKRGLFETRPPTVNQK